MSATFFLLFYTLNKLENVVEPREDEDVADLVVDASEKDVSAPFLVVLQDAQEDAQTGRRDVVQVGTVQDDVLPLHVVEHVHHPLRLPGRRRVESALQQGNHPAVLLLDGGLHRGLLGFADLVGRFLTEKGEQLFHTRYKVGHITDGVV